jgi:hypothetical protein
MQRLSPRYHSAGSLLEVGMGILTLLLALIGVVVAALSRDPITLMLLWPGPVVVTFTVFSFLRRGYHLHGGLLVLGRRLENEDYK